jgi:hypothetical protein
MPPLGEAISMNDSQSSTSGSTPLGTGYWLLVPGVHYVESQSIIH